MPFIAGFVAPVPAENKDAYRQYAEETLDYFHRLGMTRAVEAWGDDVPDGKVTDFRRAVDAKEGEVIVFAWQEFPDKATYDEAGRKMMNDPVMADMMDKMPFDAGRMIWGGFAGIFDSGKGGSMGYVDGSLIAVPRAVRKEYESYAAGLNAVILDHGATRVVDNWGEDVPDGQVTDFRRAVKAGAAEDVLFSWVEWPSKSARDAAWQKIMSDPRMHASEPPYDEGRRVFGGFTPILDA